MTTKDKLQRAAMVARKMATLTDEQVAAVLRDTAQALRDNHAEILAANRLDLARMASENPKYDRLKLTDERIEAIAGDMDNVAGLPSPLGKTLAQWERPNGMLIRKITVPFGVIGVIYEARPNVTADVFSLCLKSGNVCVLKGGSDADATNRKVVEVIHGVLEKYGMSQAVCTLLDSDREATAELLGAVGMVDLIIPRGSSALIEFVRNNARVPVIETGAGICHVRCLPG